MRGWEQWWCFDYDVECLRCVDGTMPVITLASFLLLFADKTTHVEFIMDCLKMYSCVCIFYVSFYNCSDSNVLNCDAS